MANCGHHHHHHHGENTDLKRLVAALCVTVIFLFIEVAGSIFSKSLALLADAGHMSTDALALALAISAHWFSRRPADKHLHFGYRRFQVLAAFINGILLLVLIGWIVIEALTRLYAPADVKAGPMLVVAIVGLIANGIAFAILTYGGSDNVNIRAAVLHVLGDLLGSVAAIVAALVIMATGWLRVDPLLSIVVAILIGRSAIALLRETGHILLEGAPANIDVSRLVKDLKEKAPEIVDIHNVQIWQLTPDHPRLTMHVAVSQLDAAPATLARIKSFLGENYAELQSTIQIELKNHCPDLICANAPRHQESVLGTTGVASENQQSSSSDAGMVVSLQNETIIH